MPYMISGFSDEISENVTEQFEILTKLGINYFEPRGIDGKNISALSDNEVSMLKEKMDKYKIAVSSIGSPIGKIKLEESFDEHYELFERVVYIAKTLNTKYIRIFSFYHSGKNVWLPEEREEIISRLKKMISYAKENGIVLLHENEKDIYGDTAERCEDLMKELYCDNFKMVFDPANFVQCGQNTKEAFAMLKPYIEYMHIKDALSDGTVVPSGYGEGNLQYILKNLFDNGYKGFLSLEPHLGNFKGFSELELDVKTNALPEGGEKMFTLAYNALNDILRKAGKLNG